MPGLNTFTCSLMVLSGVTNRKITVHEFLDLISETFRNIQKQHFRLRSMGKLLGMKLAIKLVRCDKHTKNCYVRSPLMILPEYVKKEVLNCGPTFLKVFREIGFRSSECFPQ